MEFRGHQYLRQRLVLATLTGKQVKINNIRSDDKNPGLRDFEVSLLRLFEKVTNGTVIEISVTGSTVLFNPGIITGGGISHDCPLSRSVGYYLEPVLMIAPFCKEPLQLTLFGITTNREDLSADIFRTVSLPLLQLFGISEGLELRIKRRGYPPTGGGEVDFRCPVVKRVNTLNFIEPGKIRRVRGIAHTVRVDPQFLARMIDTSRSVLGRFIPDIHVYSDMHKHQDSEKSPGFAMTLLAESTTSALYCAETVSLPGTAPEEIGRSTSFRLLEEIHFSGCIDRKHQNLVLLMMVLGSEDVGRCKMGQPSSRTIQFLRDIKAFFGTSVKIIPGKDSSEVLYSCYGTGFVNWNRSLA